MKVKIDSDKNNELVVLFEDEDTIINPLKSILINDKNISFAAYSKEHPQKNEVKLIIRGKNPKSSLKKAVNEFINELKELNNFFK